MSTARFQLAACLLLGLVSAVSADESPKADSTKYDLKYRFREGETIRWKVEHRAKVRTTVSGTTQTAETESHSVKVWKVKKVWDTGFVTFEHSVESILMKQRISGRQEEVYDSSQDKTPPPGFEEVAKSVGVPLSLVALDPRGRIVKREDRHPHAVAEHSQITLPLPDEPIPVGHTWSIPQEVDVPLESGVVKKIQTRQQFTLKEVKNGIASIGVETVILTPVRDPAIEAQLIQRYTAGTARFDIEQGRILSQHMELDKQVFGFRGEASTMHYETRFVETLLGEEEVVTRPKYGPEPPPGLKLRR